MREQVGEILFPFVSAIYGDVEAAEVTGRLLSLSLDDL